MQAQNLLNRLAERDLYQEITLDKNVSDNLKHLQFLHTLVTNIVSSFLQIHDKYYICRKPMASMKLKLYKKMFIKRGRG